MSATRERLEPVAVNLSDFSADGLIRRVRIDPLQHLVDALVADRATFSASLIGAVEALIARDRWSDAVRLAITVGGYQQADLAGALHVTRSTVARWYNGETRPAPPQIATYAARLVALLRRPGTPFRLDAPATVAD